MNQPQQYNRIKAMRIRHSFPEFGGTEAEVIATFGQARLVKMLDGKLELVGGSADDRANAHEWISMFMHEALIGDGPRRR
jgi:hypothetical protein